MPDIDKKFHSQSDLSIRIGRTGDIVKCVGECEACEEKIIRVVEISVLEVFELRVAV